MAKKRKTKEEKIIARLRRELKETKKELKRLEKREAPKIKQVKKEPAPLPQTLATNLYLKRDLTKSLILSILALAIEFVVYWVITKGFDISTLPAQLKIINFRERG